MKKYCATEKNQIETIIIPLLMTLVMIISCFRVVNAADAGSFSLVEYVSTHEVNSQEDFYGILELYCNQCYEPEIIENEIGFHIGVDYENMIVYTTVVEELAQTRGTKSGKATSKYYSDAGNVIFTITVEGTFSYSSSEVRTTSASGSFSKPFLSAWTSTPTISSGNYYSTLAYARISGTATSIFGSMTYILTLKCDNTGALSAG
ncbi:MAG: hypothetical protein IKX68_01775 [Clostridiales bacterium]|nr:hypothetical protein [Clostridiales bacterium]